MASTSRRGSKRYMALRVGLFFLAAGIWFAGVMTNNEWITASALVVGVAGLVIGIVARRRDANENAPEPEAEEL